MKISILQIGRVSAGGLALALAALNPGCGSLGTMPGASIGDMPSDGPVGKTMKKNAAKFEACAQDSVTVQTGAEQSIQLEFQINQAGKVMRARIKSMTAGDPDLHACVLKTLFKIKFPAPGDATSKTIAYPLVLRPE